MTAQGDSPGQPSHRFTTGEQPVNWAPEPEEFGQVHKVFTQSLGWCATDVRDLKRFTWRAPVVFGLASIAGSIAVNGGLAIANYTGDKSPPRIDYVLLWGGVVAAAILVVVGVIALFDNVTAVDKAANRVSELKY
jgi:hypothetical protein